MKKIKSITDVPVGVGFGISTPEQAAKMASFSDGAIVGSAIIKIIEKRRCRSSKACRRVH